MIAATLAFRTRPVALAGRRFLVAGVNRYEGVPKCDGILFESAQVSIDRDYLAKYGYIRAGKELRKQVRQLNFEGVSHLRVRPVKCGGGRHFDVIPVLDKKTVMGADKSLWTAVRERAKEDLESISVVKSVEVNSWQTNPVEEDLPALGSGGGGNHKPGTEDKLWALNMINLTSWTHSSGSGVVIAHPDTGYIQHPELNNVLESIAFDFYGDDEDPEDLDGHHGLGTASVIASHHTGDVFGGAPQAMIVPLRVTAPKWYKPGPVLFSMTRLRDAINHARSNGCDVVSISLGGPSNNTGLHNAIKAAYNDGMIVVAAGGNYTGNLAIYPAAYDEVIGCSACNIEGSNLFESAYGPHVEISAPGESVWRAVYEGPTATVRRGSGTSYAVSHIASLAALWLSKHGGRQVLLDQCAAAGRAPRAIGDTFRHLLITTAQASNKLDPAYGPLVNAEAVLASPPPF